MTELERILISLLLLDSNETIMLSKENQILFKYLVTEVTKAVHNIRYCSNEGCLCHPEHEIKQIINNKDIKEFLGDCLYNNLLNHCETYVPYVSSSVYGE